MIKQKIVAIVQARMSSTRLPGKILMNIEGKPVIWHIIERLKNAKNIDEIVLATTFEKADDPVEKFAKKNKISYFRGSETDVLDRFYKAAIKYKATIVVRITGDCPLTDPEVTDSIIETFMKEDYDYVSNTLEPTYPDGLDVEVFSFKALEKAWKEAKLQSEREHVTPYVWKNKKKFNVFCIKTNSDLSYLRLTLDNKEDFELISAIYSELYSKKKLFLLKDILALFKEKPELTEINSHIERNEGYRKSLKED